MFDEQAAMEATFNIATAALVGGNMIHDVGYLEQGLTSSMDMMVASNEIIDRVKRILRGIPVNDDSKALNVIDEVGPGGHYLDHDHTYDRFRDLIWQGQLTNRQNWETWDLGGRETFRDRVHAKVLEILDADTEPLMDEAMYQELYRICELADERHKDEELGFDMFA
jgi:trimethylamine--corrinoid protein Co-methyltransferase